MIHRAQLINQGKATISFETELQSEKPALEELVRQLHELGIKYQRWSDMETMCGGIVVWVEKEDGK